MKSHKAVAYAEQMPYPMEDDFRGDALQTTLPLRELIALFENEIRGLLVYDSFEYEHDASGTHVFMGLPKLHKCQYSLQAANMPLGRITLTRRSPFEEQEMQLMEKALGALSIHLGNAVESQLSLEDDQRAELQVDAYLSSC